MFRNAFVALATSAIVAALSAHVVADSHWVDDYRQLVVYRDHLYALEKGSSEFDKQRGLKLKESDWKALPNEVTFYERQPKTRFAVDAAGEILVVRTLPADATPLDLERVRLPVEMVHPENELSRYRLKLKDHERYLGLSSEPLIVKNERNEETRLYPVILATQKPGTLNHIDFYYYMLSGR
ncbi:MAG: hypothetical protein QM811_24220 [Pirellulales bacterium]